MRAVCQAAQLNPRYFYESFEDLDGLVVADHPSDPSSSKAASSSRTRRAALRSSAGIPAQPARAAVVGNARYHIEVRVTVRELSLIHI